MNTIVVNGFEVLHGTEAIRGQLMDILTDADLKFKLPGSNPTLGELCREIGQVEQSYIDSFKTFKQNFAYPPVDLALETSAVRLKDWYQKLDRELDAVLSAFSEDDVQKKMIDRGFPMPLGAQMHTYREALLIFYGKVTCYLRAMGRPLPEQMKEWVG